MKLENNEKTFILPVGSDFLEVSYLQDDKNNLTGFRNINCKDVNKEGKTGTGWTNTNYSSN